MVHVQQETNRVHCTVYHAIQVQETWRWETQLLYSLDKFQEPLLLACIYTALGIQERKSWRADKICPSLTWCLNVSSCSVGFNSFWLSGLVLVCGSFYFSSRTNPATDFTGLHVVSNKPIWFRSITSLTSDVLINSSLLPIRLVIQLHLLVSLFVNHFSKETKG